MIPPEIKWDPDATPPQYTDNADQVIEKGTNLRIKLIGLRNDVRNMFAIGSIREDYLGFVVRCQVCDGSLADHISNQDPVMNTFWPCALVAPTSAGLLAQHIMRSRMTGCKIINRHKNYSLCYQTFHLKLPSPRLYGEIYTTREPPW